jgi:hypothetical protein
MAKRSGRYISVMRTENGVSIMLSCVDKDLPEYHQVESVQIKYNTEQIIESVENAINTLVDKWVHVFVSGVHMSAVSECLDKRPEKFDMLMEAEEPEQALVSKYILG